MIARMQILHHIVWIVGEWQNLMPDSSTRLEARLCVIKLKIIRIKTSRAFNMVFLFWQRTDVNSLRIPFKQTFIVGLSKTSTPRGLKNASICGLNRMGTSSGMGNISVALPNAWPKSMAMTLPLNLSIRKFSELREEPYHCGGLRSRIYS
jgi:hypothetical protein